MQRKLPVFSKVNLSSDGAEQSLAKPLPSRGVRTQKTAT